MKKQLIYPGGVIALLFISAQVFAISYDLTIPAVTAFMFSLAITRIMQVQPVLKAAGFREFTMVIC